MYIAICVYIVNTRKQRSIFKYMCIQFFCILGINCGWVYKGFRVLILKKIVTTLLIKNGGLKISTLYLKLIYKLSKS